MEDWIREVAELKQYFDKNKHNRHSKKEILLECKHDQNRSIDKITCPSIDAAIQLVTLAGAYQLDFAQLAESSQLLTALLQDIERTAGEMGC